MNIKNKDKKPKLFIIYPIMLPGSGKSTLSTQL